MFSFTEILNQVAINKTETKGEIQDKKYLHNQTIRDLKFVCTRPNIRSMCKSLQVLRWEVAQTKRSNYTYLYI